MGYDVEYLMKRFKGIIVEIAEELQLEYEDIPDTLGQSDTGFYFYKSTWKHCVIDFEFDSAWASNFFYGICRKDLQNSIPADIIQKIQKRLGNIGWHF
jgi:hypothetical protein